MTTAGTKWSLSCQGVISVADSSLLQVVKRIVKETLDAEKPCDYLVGTVTSENPLKIKVSNTLALDADFLDLARSVTDFEVPVSIDESSGWNTAEQGGGSGEAAFAPHGHGIAVTEKKIKIHGALKQGEKVLLLRKKKGKRYAVVDRVVSG